MRRSPGGYWGTIERWVVAVLIALPLGMSALPVRAAEASITQYPVNAPAGVRGLTRATDGAFWFVEMDRGDTIDAVVPARIGRLQPTGELTEYAIPTMPTTPNLPTVIGYDPEIAAASDGAVWFTEPWAKQVARVAANGAITEYTVPNAESELRGLVIAPDSAAWISTRERTFQIAADGTTAMLPVHADSLAVGPDGNVWGLLSAGGLVRFGAGGNATTVPLSGGGAAYLHTLYGITLGPDGNFWGVFWASGRPSSQYVFRITPAGAVTKFDSVSPLNGIIAAGDGNLWAKSFTGSSLNRITLTGAVTEVRIPAQVIGGLSADTSGNVWFATAATATGENYIGWLDPGTIAPAAPPPARLMLPGITEFDLPDVNASSSITNLIIGPDGNFWFTLANTAKIGKMTPTGSTTTYDLPPAQYPQYRLAAGADGNVWFTERGVGRIGKITPGGVVTEFPLLTADSGPTQIVRGIDNALWFVEAYAKKIGRSTTEGVISEYITPWEPGALLPTTDGVLFIPANTDILVRTTFGKVTAAGVVTQVANGAAGRQLVPGPDGTLWALSSGPCDHGTCTRLSAISATGTTAPVTLLDEYRVGGASIQFLAVGVDGTIWFTRGANAYDMPPSGGRIGRLTPDGKIAAEYAVPGNPSMLLLRANGDIWFGEAVDSGNTARIARLQPAAAMPLPLPIATR